MTKRARQPLAMDDDTRCARELLSLAFLIDEAQASTRNDIFWEHVTTVLEPLARSLFSTLSAESTKKIDITIPRSQHSTDVMALALATMLLTEPVLARSFLFRGTSQRAARNLLERVRAYILGVPEYQARSTLVSSANSLEMLAKNEDDDDDDDETRIERRSLNISFSSKAYSGHVDILFCDLSDSKASAYTSLKAASALVRVSEDEDE